MKLGTILEFLEQFAPKELAEEWDNVGMLIGRTGDEIKKALVTLDFTEDALELAISEGAEMIITHHPVIFKPVSSINNPLIIKAIANDICVYSAHTNLDIAKGGVNDVLAEVIGLEDVRTDTILRVGCLEKEMESNEFKEHIKSSLCVSALRCNLVEKKIFKVGVVGGAGGDFITLAKENGCDAFLTGEASYHEAQLAESLDVTLVCAGHYETEQPIVKSFAKRLRNKFPQLEVIEGESKNLFPIK